MPKHTWFLIGRNSVNWKGNQKWSIADCQPCWIVCCSVAKLCPTLCNYMHCSIPGSSVLHCLLEFAQIHVLWVSDAVSSHPLLSPSPLPSVFPSIRVFSNESAFHIRWPKYWSLTFSISPSHEYSGLISFSMDWLDLLLRSRSEERRVGKECSG